MEQVVSWMCEAPARIWDIANKGRLQIGYDADLTVVDLDHTEVIRNEEQQTKCGWSPWHNQSLTGWPVATWVMGQPVFRREANGKNWFASEWVGQEIQFDHAS